MPLDARGPSPGLHASGPEPGLDEVASRALPGRCDLDNNIKPLPSSESTVKSSHCSQLPAVFVPLHSLVADSNSGLLPT